MKAEEYIRIHAQNSPGKIALVCGDMQMSYGEFWDGICRRAEELSAAGLRARQPYVFRASQDMDFLLTYCAVHVLDAIAVPLERSVSQEYFDSVQAEVQAHTFAPDIMDILYTTGTTGKAKGVMLGSKVLESCSDNFIDSMEYTPDLLYIISGPLNHIASLSKIHPMLVIGGTIAIMDGLKDMNALFDVFNLPFKKFATFLVPASIRLIMQFSYDKLCAVADKIDFIETGAAPITSEDMRRLAQALPNSRLYNTLGGTEIGAVCTYNFNDGKYMEGCVGRCMKHSHIEIGEEGNLIISGDTIMSGYLGDEEGTRQVVQDGKVHSADLGYIDEDGLIHLTGRKGDIINVGGFKVNPLDVEKAAGTHPSIRECACTSAQHPVVGTVLKLVVVLNDGFTLDKHAIAVHIKNQLESHKVPTYYQQVEKLPRTYNGKLDRKSL